jgi:hypothetical protein
LYKEYYNLKEENKNLYYLNLIKELDDTYNILLKTKNAYLI